MGGEPHISAEIFHWRLRRHVVLCGRDPEGLLGLDRAPKGGQNLTETPKPPRYLLAATVEFAHFCIIFIPIHSRTIAR